MKATSIQQQQQIEAANINAAPRPKLQADINFSDLEYGLYAPHLSDEEADKFMDALSEVMHTFVELGFGTHPTQQVHSSHEIRAELAAMADRIFRAVA